MSETKREWTKAQKAAIDIRDGDLIISAAAGSGKTAVLCERVINSLLDENDPISVSDMLIVTFTKASANELRVRIANKLREKIAESASSRHLMRELMLLQSADIGTIHSFCGNLITKNTALLGLPSSVRVADETEIKVISSKIIEKAINEAYESDRDFPEFAANFTSASDKNLGEKLLDIYYKTQNHTDGIEVLSSFARNYLEITKENWSETLYAREIMKSLREEVEYFLDSFTEDVKYLRNDEKAYSKYGEACEYDLSYLKSIKDALSIGWDALQELLNVEYDSKDLRPLRGNTDSRIDEIKTNRGEIKKCIEGIVKNYSFDMSSLPVACHAQAKFLSTLYRTLFSFEKAFSAEKMRLSIIDFTDLERMAYKLLVDSEGKPTALANEVGKKYRQIYIDEYQDTNAVQDAIFSAISRDNRFMVGDIKQSIYGFRGAEPSIFARYRDSFADIPDTEKDIERAHRIFLSNNFRCDKPIVDFSNGIFAKIFAAGSGKISYLDEDALVFSKKSERTTFEKVEIILAEKDNDCAYYAEALTVAKKIKELTASGVSPSNIAVLTRSFGDNATVLKKIFEKTGIETDNSASENLFETPEVLLILSLLNCIDNPHRDIWLSGALTSKIFGITFDDIIDLASEKYDGKMSLYDKMRTYCEENDFEKGKSFLKWLENARKNAKGMRVFEIIDSVCTDLGITALAVQKSENAPKAKKYIEAFKTLARSYEKNSFRGLHSFLMYVEDIKDTDGAKKLLSSGESENVNAVKLMTVHGSKGLEFEYCFLYGCGKEMNKNDNRADFLLSTSFGVAVQTYGLSSKVKFTSPMYSAMKEHIYKEGLDEEMRVLYVALTRARTKLFITAENMDPEKLLSGCSKIGKTLSPYILAENASYIYWILSSLDTENPKDFEIFISKASSYYDRERITEVLIKKYGEKEILPTAEEISEISEKSEIKAEGSSEKIEIIEKEESKLTFDEIKKRLEYKYPYESELSLPAKLSVSKLFPDVLDRDYTELVEDRLEFTDIPKFMADSLDDKITGAMRGTATHAFMQFCDFENAEKNGVEVELARLCDKKFLDAKTADMVYIGKLKLFFKSSLYAEIKSAKTLWREKRFSLMLPASDFTEDIGKKAELSDTKLLVQGVFDCLIEQSDGTLKLIDYKTDAVSGDFSADEKMFRERYFTQLSYYKLACEKMLEKTVSSAVIYSLSMGREIRII